jgi:lipopolysaccharide export system permease protein
MSAISSGESCKFAAIVQWVTNPLIKDKQSQVFNRLFKKLDILIVKAFLGPFIATFFITTFVLVLQFMWLYIDDMVGKGLDAWTVLRMLMYIAATVVPLALPLAVLLSSIMTLGNLGETYELVAIKSAGISLLRFLRPLFVVTVVITLLAFFFNNNVYPVANLKMQTLKYDIIYTKPAFDIKEGVFFDRIDGYVIKIGKKESNDSVIRNVVIYEQNTSGQQDNMIVADSGTMVVTADKQNLIFTLKDGWRYQEKGERYVTAGTQLIRMGFKEYKKVMDLSSFKMNKTEDSTFKNNFQMLTIVQLGRNIDSLKRADNKIIQQSSHSLALNLQFPAWLDTTGWEAIEKKPVPSRFLLNVDWARDSLHKIWVADSKTQDSLQRIQDSVKKAQKNLASAVKGPKPGPGNPPATPPNTTPVAAKPAQPPTGSPTAAKPVTAPTHPGQAAAPPSIHPGQAPLTVRTHPQITPIVGQPGNIHTANPGITPVAVHPVPKEPPQPTFNDLLPDSVRMDVTQKAVSIVNQSKVSLYQPMALFNAGEKNLLQHQVAWHEKITLAIACMVMFIIGAPLGSIIRKGGIGMPLVFAVVFFVIFFLLNNFGKKLAGQAVLSPFQGMWMATYVLTPIGIFLIYKALNDSQLFNKEFYFRLTRKIRPLLARLRKAKPVSGGQEPAGAA